jgi:hypothetical protein
MVTTTMPATRSLAFPAGIITAARFVGHFLLALVGVIFLGSNVDH